jgi:hypothetical protein
MLTRCRQLKPFSEGTSGADLETSKPTKNRLVDAILIVLRQKDGEHAAQT